MLAPLISSSCKTITGRERTEKVSNSAKYLAAKALAKVIKTSIGNIEIVNEANGRPAGYFCKTKYAVSISHCPSFIAVAATKCSKWNLGIDVESTNSFNSIEDGFLKLFLSNTELNDLGEEKPVSELAELWVRKEAHVKALGTGFEKDPKHYDVKSNGIYNGHSFMSYKDFQPDLTHKGSLALLRPMNSQLQENVDIKISWDVSVNV